METITKLNREIRESYENARYIKHYQGKNQDETHATVDKMPNTNESGRIFIGYTDHLREHGLDL